MGFRQILSRTPLETLIKSKTIATDKEMITFKPEIDFKKAYDSVDTETLMKILEELGVDAKTIKLIRQPLTDNESQVKFLEELSKQFKAKTGSQIRRWALPVIIQLPSRSCEHISTDPEKQGKHSNHTN